MLPMTTGELEALRSLAHGLVRADPANRDAHLRLFEVEQMLGEPERAVEHLRAAVRLDPIVTTTARRPAELTVLALSRVAPWEANTPLELVLDLDRATLHRWYAADGDAAFAATALPPYDVVFNTIAESEAARPALAAAQAFAARCGRPVINAPEVVATLGRADVARRFAASRTIVAPPVERVEAAALRERQVGVPLVVRPVGSQAGLGLELAADRDALIRYLDGRGDAAYFVTPFVDYRSDDGFFRKYRIMFVGGRPFAYHLAISPRWMIHYYNAAMDEHQWMRDEEARFIEDLDATVRGPARAALDEIASAIPLEYFGIDCALSADGRLLLFEADAAMLVHGTDDPDRYGYKKPAFERVQAALHVLLRSKAGRD